MDAAASAAVARVHSTPALHLERLCVLCLSAQLSRYSRLASEARLRHATQGWLWLGDCYQAIGPANTVIYTTACISPQRFNYTSSPTGRTTTPRLHWRPMPARTIFARFQQQFSRHSPCLRCRHLLHFPHPGRRCWTTRRCSG